MRMIGIGLMGFLLAGIALLLSTMNILEQGKRYIHEVTSGPQLVFEHRTPAKAQDLYEAVILRADPDNPVILSGFPAYQSVAFMMPVDARPTSGYLQIDATSQVLDGVEGVLRISINNTRRGEMLLRSGEVGRSLQIPLSMTDFAGNQLVVSFSLQGTGTQLQCGSQDGFEAVVEIETTSAVFLTLDRPLQSVRDQVHAWGNVVRVAWPDWLKKDEQLRRMVLATQFQRRGLATVFAPSSQEPALSTLELRAALPAFPETELHTNVGSALPRKRTNVGLRRFYRQALWRERFDLGGRGGQYIPNQLDLRMQLGRLMHGQNWSLTVTLNNRLVFQEHTTGAHAEYRALIDLPSDIQVASNTLEVVATTTAPQDGVCDLGPELVAELLPDSRLIVGETPFADDLSGLQSALQNVGPVNIAMTSELTALDASVVSRILHKVVPAGVELKPAGRKVHITVLSPNHPTPPLTEAGPTWLVTVTQGLSVRKLQQNETVSHVGLALLISPTVPSLPEADG
nr:cellulose biosynthesis cyclic di-GMP-binding regulatory protein BcsB [uncultured Ruegeria sp.]